MPESYNEILERRFVGRKLVKIESGEYYIRLTFDNGQVIEVEGRTYEDCSLSIDHYEVR